MIRLSGSIGVPTAAVLFAALTLGHFCLVRGERRPITAGRIFGVALILCGLAFAFGLF